MEEDDELIESIAEFLRGKAVTTEDMWWFLPLEEKFGREVLDKSFARAKELDDNDPQEPICNLWLGSIGPNKGRTIKAVQLLLGLNSNEAEKLVSQAPVVIKEGVSVQDAGKLIVLFRSHGIGLQRR